MSRLGMKNYRARGNGDAMVRALVMARDLEVFCSDVGDRPLTAEQAKAIMARGGIPMQGKAWRSGFEPVCGLDCLGALDEGAEEWRRAEDEWRSELIELLQDERDVEMDPVRDIRCAFWEAEVEVWRQIDGMWAAHECGGFAPEALPLFLRRATLEEDVLDMAYRQLRAEHRQEDIRMGMLIGW